MKRSGKWIAAVVILAAMILAVGIHYRSHRLVIRLRVVEPHLTEIDLVNRSSADQALNRDVWVTWNNGDANPAQGGLAGFDAVDSGVGTVIFRPGTTTRPTSLHAGEELAVGWIRLSSDPPLDAHFGAEP
ncbi:MAG: hypothetical protein ABSF29_01835 [Tepidisphaeraceae bacterium]